MSIVRESEKKKISYIEKIYKNSNNNFQSKKRKKTNQSKFTVVQPKSIKNEKLITKDFLKLIFIDIAILLTVVIISIIGYVGYNSL